ncbi:hypothetical protein GDO78_004798 [Eleutherodactylus coqui]|uniref:Uncharacterized protein n=1 Tax=Eleutherodactylus coqui TaxID=57060 RepID=A0A8J6K082_ELECQ|nr:hypothetical protein GDO78_004798 [Eleutherodactylus coqui]
MADLQGFSLLTPFPTRCYEKLHNNDVLQKTSTCPARKRSSSYGSGTRRCKYAEKTCLYCVKILKCQTSPPLIRCLRIHVNRRTKLRCFYRAKPVPTARY